MLTLLQGKDASTFEYGVFDIETEGLNSKAFKFAVTKVNGVHEVHDSPDELKAFLVNSRWQGYHFYGHNIEYDLHSMFDNVLTIKDKNIIYNTRFIKLAYCCKTEKRKKSEKNPKGITKRYINFQDTYNLIPLGLRDIGKNLKLEKLKLDQKAIIDKTIAAIEYCKRDCDITEKLLQEYIKFCSLYHISPKLTTSSTAMAIFRTNFLEKDIWIHKYDVIFKNGYTGGRCEVFDKILLNGVHGDVNSLYPAAMCIDGYPDPSHIKKGNKNNVEEFKRRLIDFEGCAHVKVKSPEINIPVLPHRGDKVIYPVGEFYGWYNFNELRFAMIRGYEILELKEYYYAPRILSPFKKYVEHFYDEKEKYREKKDPDTGEIIEEGNPAMFDFCKRMMNGLYGKFGEYHDNGEWGYIDEDYDLSKYDFNEVKSTKWGYWMKKGETIQDQITEHTIFCWASYVTSYARILLYQEMEKVNMRVSYTDTDAIFTTDKIKGSKKLGELKIEHECINCYFIRPKHYMLEPVIPCNDFIYYAIDRSKNKIIYKLKGVGVKNVNRGGIMKKSYTVQRVVKAREALRRGLIAGSPLQVIKEPSHIDDKRVWHGGKSEPIRLME